MSNLVSRRKMLVLLTVATLLTLLLLPATSWLIRLQLTSQIVPSFLTPDREKAERRVAATHPNDYQLQLARSLAAPMEKGLTSTTRVRRLQDLSIEFPNEPAVYAHLLRYYTMGQVHIHRSEEDELLADPPHRTGEAKHSLPADLNGFEEAAAQGERLDADNAYFPLMRAAGLFEAHRDAEAIAALHRAGQKTRFEDYSNDEVVALDRFYREAHGQTGVMGRAAIHAALLFPHYAVLRSMARMALVSALHCEVAGQQEEGYRIRHDIMQSGALMRVQGRWLICNLVGIAISSIATSRPGGEPAATVDNTPLTKAQSEARTEAKRQKYYAYLTCIGHAEEARWAQAELEAGMQTKQISAKITEVGPFNMRSLMKTSLWWLSNLVTLSNVLSLLLLGGAASIAARIRPQSNLNLWRGVLVVVVLGVFGLWLANVQRAVGDWCATPMQMLTNLSDVSEQSNGETQAVTMITRGLSLVLPLALPCLLLFAIGIVSFKARDAFATSVGRWLRALAVPMACLLFLLYGMLLCGTARQEAQMNAGLDEQSKHEGKYLASCAGVTWPGAAH